MLFRSFIGVLLGGLVRIWLHTIRTTVIGAASTAVARPSIFAFQHGQLFSMLAIANRFRLCALVSKSSDGDYLASALSLFGVRVCRGSSSRGGLRAVFQLLREIESTHDVAITVDGPKGPAGVVKPGVFALAKHSNALVIPCALACSRSYRLKKSWDCFEIPAPFSRVVIVFGNVAPSDCYSVENACLSLGEQLRTLKNRAEQLVQPQEEGV